LREAALYLTGYRQDEVYGVRTAALEVMPTLRAWIEHVRDVLQDVVADRLPPVASSIGRQPLDSAPTRSTRSRAHPKDIVVVGGGPEGVEFASAFTALGIPATLVSLSDRLLSAPRTALPSTAIAGSHPARRSVHRPGPRWPARPARPRPRRPGGEPPATSPPARRCPGAAGCADPRCRGGTRTRPAPAGRPALIQAVMSSSNTCPDNTIAVHNPKIVGNQWRIPRGSRGSSMAAKHGPQQVDRYRNSQFGHFAAYTNPVATLDGLNWIADWCVWLFAFDDEFCDEDSLGLHPGKLAREIVPLIRVLDNQAELHKVRCR
jgi:Pyridine nucleotide-disulphide oxidoreductase